MNEWREILYPLGLLSSIFFAARVLLQWISSELKGKSDLSPAFWKLSLCGNALLALHALIQVQFHVCLIQACNGVISWRNLNLMKVPVSFRRTLTILFSVIVSVYLVFFFQGYFILKSEESWFRIPVTPWQQALTPLSMTWHLFGFLGMILFSSRFWLQWWCAERRGESYLGPSFWWISLIGEGVCCFYFFIIGDLVNFIGPAFALIPYTRNLMLIYKKIPG